MRSVKCANTFQVLRKLSTSSSKLFSTAKSLNKNQEPLRCGWLSASHTKMTLEAKREGTNQRDPPFTIATKCECFAFVII